MAINFSDTTPAAPTGAVNVKWQQDGGGNVSAFTTAGAGTVSSVGLTMPPEFQVANSPITAAGVLAVSKVNQPANLVYASPASGSGPPAFRALTAGDIPGAGAVSSVFGRTGAVIAASGDYTAAQVTNAVSTAGAYADPAWITSLAWSKITGAPAATGQTPWLSNIDAAGFSLANVPSISASAALTLAAGGAGALNLNTNAKTRLSIDSAGHVTINSPDTAGAAVTIPSLSDSTPALVAGGIRSNLGTPNNAINPQLWAGVFANYVNAANWNGLIVANTWQASNATAFAVGSVNSGAWTQYFAIDGIGNLIMGVNNSSWAGNAGMPNSSLVLTYSSNTQLVFRFKGTDGVIRQGTLAVA